MEQGRLGQVKANAGHWICMVLTYDEEEEAFPEKGDREIFSAS